MLAGFIVIAVPLPIVVVYGEAADVLPVHEREAENPTVSHSFVHGVSLPLPFAELFM